MGRYRKQLFENFQDENFNPDTRYELAYKRVKRIKGFYIHLLVYVFVNAFIIVSSFNRSALGSEFFLDGKHFLQHYFGG